MQSAVSELLRLVASGVEYPEAHTRCVLKYGVDGDELSALYDAECAK